MDEAIGVIFDMDGVLIDSADQHFESWRRMASEIGADVTRSQFDATFGRQNRDIIPIVFDVHDPARIRWMADRKEELYREIIRTEPPLVSGAAELVLALRSRGARLAVGSSAPRANVEMVVDLLGVGDAFTALVSGDEVSRGKPDPMVFQMACERLGLEPNRCVVVEDAPAGVAAAKAAGCRVVAILIHHRREDFTGTDLFVPRLNELTADALFGLARG